VRGALSYIKRQSIASKNIVRVKSPRKIKGIDESNFESNKGKFQVPLQIYDPI
jgi:hypothetical protein